MPCKVALPEPTAATLPIMDHTVAKTTAAATAWKPSPFFCMKQGDSEQKDTVHSSAEEVCSGSERRAEHITESCYADHHDAK